MKVLFFVGQLKQGGAERVVSIISNKLVERGFDVEILSYYDSEINYYFDSRIKITKVIKESKTNNLIKNTNWLKNYFKNNSDIIISFMAPFNILSLWANRNNDVSIIVSDRNDPRRVPSNIILRVIRNKLYKKANYVVVQTEHNKEYFSNLNNVVVINNPIDLKELASKALNTSKENKIVSIGRLMPQKNHIMLINAFNEFVKKHNDYKLVIYGEGSYRTELEKKIKELNLSDSILLPGETTNILNEILDAKLFVLSSNYEGMPNALVEAMCLGLPCISTKVSGANELIKNKENGLLIDINNTNQLLELMKLLIEDNELAIKLANNATKLNQELNVDRIVNNWIELINKAI